MNALLYSSPIGPLWLEAEDAGLTRLHWLSPHEMLPHVPASLVWHSSSPAWQALGQAQAWLDAYFAHGPLPPLPPLHLCGTPFQCAVWHILQQIPYGSTTTYGAIAHQIGPHTSARAVGQAVGANPVAIIVPCHRVLAAHGLGGFAYGAEVKSALLSIEGTCLF